MTTDVQVRVNDNRKMTTKIEEHVKELERTYEIMVKENYRLEKENKQLKQKLGELKK